MTNWNMRTEELELKDGSTIKNYHYEFNSTDRVLAKIVEDVFKGIMDIKADRKSEPQNYCDDCLYRDTCDDKAFFYACTSKATISKVEQVDKDINVRSKDELQTCSVNGRPYDCGKCEHFKCTADEPQTERSE